MSYFGGEAKVKTVSLRGRSAAVPDKKDVAEAAKKERMKRARDREELEAAARIQVCPLCLVWNCRRWPLHWLLWTPSQASFRKWCKWRRIAEGLCATWDRRVADLDKLAGVMAARGVTFVPPTSAVLELLCSLLWFSRYLHDAMGLRRLSRMCGLLSASCSSPAPASNICCAFKSAPTAAVLTAQVRRVGVSCASGGVPIVRVDPLSRTCFPHSQLVSLYGCCVSILVGKRYAAVDDVSGLEAALTGLTEKLILCQAWPACALPAGEGEWARVHTLWSRVLVQAKVRGLLCRAVWH